MRALRDHPHAHHHARHHARALAGRYRLIEEIGAGGMGSVWRAWDLRDRRPVAVKLLARHDDALLQRFVREQAVRVTHPHVVAPTGWAADEGSVLLTMDLVAGGSLETLLREHGPLPEGVVAVLLDQLLQALGAVHAAGVVHRDVKPANLLLEATGTGRPHLRLADFGVAAVLDAERLTLGGRVGTDGYAAPEQVAGADPDPRQDLHAAGVVGRLLLTGQEPGSAPAARPTPGALGPLIDALADPDPDRRPASAVAALDRLRGAGCPVPEHWPVVPDRVGGATDPAYDAGRLAVVLACLCFAAAIALSAAAVLLAT